VKPIIEDQVAKPFPYENFPDEYPGDLNKKPKKKESFKLLCKTKKQWAKEILKAKNQALKEVLELKLMKDEEMPIHSGIYGDSNIKPDVRNKLRQQLRASIKEMINDYSSASDRAENKYQEGTYEQ